MHWLWHQFYGEDFPECYVTSKANYQRKLITFNVDFRQFEWILLTLTHLMCLQQVTMIYAITKFSMTMTLNTISLHTSVKQSPYRRDHIGTQLQLWRLHGYQPPLWSLWERWCGQYIKNILPSSELNADTGLLLLGHCILIEVITSIYI